MKLPRGLPADRLIQIAQTVPFAVDCQGLATRERKRPGLSLPRSSPALASPHSRAVKNETDNSGSIGLKDRGPEQARRLLGER